jgi:cation transport ATPase
VSPHVFASGIVAAARNRGLLLEFPREVHEHAGRGIEGLVGGRHVAVGQARWLARDRPLPAPVSGLRRRIAMEGLSSVYVALDGQFAGAMVMIACFAITRRPPVGLSSGRHQRIVVPSGDRDQVSQQVGRALGVDAVISERTPAQRFRPLDYWPTR